MAITLSVAVRNARLDVIETTIGVNALVRIYSGTVPTNAGTALSGNTLLAETAPVSDWMAAAASGSKALVSALSDTSANATGTASFFRVYDSTGTTCHIQGTVTVTGGGGDMTVDNTSFATGQAFTINTFTLTDGNA